MNTFVWMSLRLLLIFRRDQLRRVSILTSTDDALAAGRRPRKKKRTLSSNDICSVGMRKGNFLLFSFHIITYWSSIFHLVN